MLEHITSNEIAGYAVGAFLLCSTLSAPKFDSFISSSQRRSLDMCKRCGDLKLIACQKCKGSGVIKKWQEPFSFFIIGSDDPKYQLVDTKSRITPSSCTKCQARGHFRCPECSKLPQS